MASDQPKDEHLSSDDRTTEAHPTPAELPAWYRWSAIVLASLLTFLLLLLTFVVWAFRGGDNNHVALWIFGAEVLLLGVFLAFGRKTFWKWAAVKYRWLTTRTGQAVAVAATLLIALLIAPGLQGPGKPVADASGHRVAVIGGGSAGVHSAWMLHQAGIDFDLYEATDAIGGHAYSPTFTPDEGTPFDCDIGFIFGSPVDYQEMKVLMDWHGVERTQAELGVSSLVDGAAWACGPDVSSEAKRFMRLADEEHNDASLNMVPFGFWLTLNGFSEQFRREYIAPLLSIIFITDVGQYEISARFVLNLAAGRLQWIDFERGSPAWTVKGGTRTYYERLSKEYKDHIRLQTPVTKVTRKGDKVIVEAFGPGGKQIEEVYDDVIFAVPADVAHALLQDKDWLEDFLLSEVRYEDGELVLHTDDTLLPKEELRRQYNYFQDNKAHPGEFELSGIMNWVHSAGYMSPLPVGTLNPLRPIDPEKVIVRRGWRHHAMDLWHLALMLEGLPSIQGRGGVWYAGDWVTVIGHGPAMRTGMAAACNVGAKSRIKKAPEGARCIDVRVEEDRAGKPAVDVHLCGEEELFAYFVERQCNGFKI